MHTQTCTVGQVGGAIGKKRKEICETGKETRESNGRRCDQSIYMCENAVKSMIYLMRVNKNVNT